MVVGGDSNKGFTLRNVSACRPMPSAERRARELARHRRLIGRSARVLAAAALLALSGALALPATAEAQSETTLVTNLDKGTVSTITVGTNGNRASQEFKVPDADPDQDYVLTAVTVNIDTSGNNFRMAIHGKSGSNPGDQIYSLKGPSNPGTGLQTYTAPDGATLENGKSYFLVIRGGSSGTRVRRTASEGQSGLSGWTIANGSRNGADSWFLSADIVKMTVSGFALLDAEPLTLTAEAVAPMQVTLDWNRVLPALKTIDLDAGYGIEWSPDGSTSWMSLVDDLWCTCYPTKFNDDTIEPGETRYYRIQAVDDDQASVYSNVVSATTPGLVDSDGGLILPGAVESQLDALNDQKVFRIRLETDEYPVPDQRGGAEAPGDRDRSGRHGD